MPAAKTLERRATLPKVQPKIVQAATFAQRRSPNAFYHGFHNGRELRVTFGHGSFATEDADVIDWLLDLAQYDRHLVCEVLPTWYQKRLTASGVPAGAARRR